MRLADTLARFPRPFWALWAGTLANRTGMVVLPFLPLYLTAERGMTVERAALAVSLYGAGAFAGGFAGGAGSDRVGRRPVLLASLAGGALAVALLPFAPTFAAVGAVAFGFGFVGEMYRPAVSAAVADLVPQERQPEAFALLYWAINVGSAVGPALGGLLVAGGYGRLFWLDGATMLVFAAVVALAVPETQPAAAPGGHAGRAPTRAVLSDGALAGLSVCVLLVGVAFMQAFATLSLAMAADGLSPLDFGLVVSVNGGLIVLLGLPVAAWAGRRIGGGVPAAAVAAIGVGLALHAPAHTLAAYAAGAVVWTLGEMAFLPLVPTLVARLAPDGAQGTYQGVYHGAWGLSKTVGPALGGLVLAHAGGTALWLGTGALALAAAAGLLALAPTFRRRLAASA